MNKSYSKTWGLGFFYCSNKWSERTNFRYKHHNDYFSVLFFLHVIFALAYYKLRIKNNENKNNELSSITVVACRGEKRAWLFIVWSRSRVTGAWVAPANKPYLMLTSRSQIR